MTQISKVIFKSEKKKTKISTDDVFNSSEKAVRLAREIYEVEELDVNCFEAVFCLFFNRQGKAMSYLKVSEGGLSSSIIDVKKIAKAALDVFAHSVIMFHNHPSGNLKPSKEDIGATEKVKIALNLFDVQLLDHLILTDEESFSFNDEGLIY